MLKIGCTLANCSPRRRTGWTEQVAFPRPAGGAGVPDLLQFVADDGREFTGVRGEDVGEHSVTFRFRCTLEANEVVSGVVIDAPDSVKLEPFVLHPWVSDDLQSIVPIAGLLKPDGTVAELLQPLELSLVSFSPVHQRWYARMASSELGLVQELWADLCHMDPVVKLTGAVTWSDRRDTARLKTFFGILGLHSGEQLALDFTDRHGWIRSEHQGQKLVLFGSNQTFIDGASIPFSGSVLCFRGPNNVGPWTPTPQDWEDVNNLEAAKGGPMLGIAHNWHGSFLGAKGTPVRGSYPVDQFEWERFQQMLQQRATLLTPRPIGCAPAPGQTGDQEDFGASKGTRAVTFLDPRWIYEARYSVQAECFRGYRHFEKDGTALDPSKHPNWETWGGKTGFWFQGVSDDATLGKQGGYWPEPPGGWTGYDDEHRSQNNLAAYLALTGDPLLITQWCHLTTTDVMSVTHKRPTTAAQRAEGRLIETWANMALVLPGEARRRALELVGRRVLLAAQKLQAITGPMVLMESHGPDGRKPLYNAAGQLVETATIWELGLHLVGLACAVRSGTCLYLALAQDVLVQLSRTMARYGCFLGANGWKIVQDVEWRGGGDVDVTLARETEPGKWSLAIFDGNDGDVRSWTRNGMLVARATLRDVDPSLAAKLNTCLVVMGVNLQSPKSQRDAEWWAVLNP
jgi:hypothetical protein